MELALAFLTLTCLEIVLGVDNIIFISILTNKLPSEIRKKARRLGIALALVFRILMLLSITWIMGFQEALFQIKDHPVSGRDLVLFAGGVFLLWNCIRRTALWCASCWWPNRLATICLRDTFIWPWAFLWLLSGSTFAAECARVRRILSRQRITNPCFSQPKLRAQKGRGQTAPAVHRLRSRLAYQPR